MVKSQTSISGELRLRSDAQDAQEPGVEKKVPSPIAAFTGTIAPSRVTVMYQIGLALVALAMLLLSVIYVGLIVCVGYGVYWHLRNDAFLLHPAGASIVAWMFYFGPAIGGVVLIFFLIKPYFAGAPEPPPRYSLTSESDPVLFAFIARICELVHAPLPSRVDVDCEINASASFREGFMSLRNNDVVLTIGLPLAAGLTMQEFAGVLAHEFGHFAQGAGMRLTYVIRRTNTWFARVVYERDEWDVALHRTAYSMDIRAGAFLHVIRFLIWLSRRVLWVLMHIGHLFSCFMLRQMEYDADSYETKLVGSAAFASTVNKLQGLFAASQWVGRKMDETWRTGRLPENLPAFISVAVKNVPQEIREEIEKGPERKKTRIFDTHPCDADRVRAATAMNQPGIFHLTEPATNLFSDFAGLSRAATRFHYESNLELRITEHNLVAHEQLADESQAQADGSQALRDYFLGLKWVFRPISISGSHSESALLPASTAELVATLKRSRQAMEESKPAVQKALAEYETAEGLYQRGLNALVQTSQQATEKATATIQELVPVLEPFEKHANNRLTCALRLCQDPDIAGKLANADVLLKEVEHLTPVFERLSQAFGPLQELRRNFGAFEAALGALNQEGLAKKADKRIAQLVPALHQEIKDIRTAIDCVRYPFRHPREDITLEEFARTDIPATHKLEALFNNCACHLNRLLPVYYRVLGRLTFIAMKVEEKI
jgi:Zn-dependent protease with chaperone function